LSTVEEAITFLSQLLATPESDDEAALPVVELAGELTTLRIEVEGGNYHSSVTGNLSRGLWELQQEVYRAAARSLYGIASIRKLSKEDLEAYNLVFDVKDGSSDIVADIKEILGHLKDGINSMSEMKRLILYIGVAVIVTSGVGYAYVKARDIDAQKDVQLAEQTTAQMEVVRKAAQIQPDLLRWRDAAEAGARSVTKGASDATSIRIGREVASREEIQEINRRAPRTPSGTEIIEDEFRVIVTKDTDSQIRNVHLSRAGLELVAIMDESQFEEEQLNEFWDAVRYRKPITLSVAVKTAGETYKNAVIIDIPPVDGVTVAAAPPAAP
jgi:hypothetical protein